MSGPTEFDPNAYIDVRAGRKFPYATVGDYVALADISDKAARVYWVLRMHVNRERGDDLAWPSQQTIAEIVGNKHRNSIIPAIRELVALGAVDVEVVTRPRGTIHVYTVHEAPPLNYAGRRSLSEYYAAVKAARKGGAQDVVHPPATSENAAIGHSGDAKDPVQGGATDAVRPPAKDPVHKQPVVEPPVFERESPPTPPPPAAGRDDGAHRADDEGTPPASGAPRALCEEHGKTTCRPCNHNTRNAAKAESARERHEERERSMNCPWCPRSPDDNIRTQGVVPIAPATICDHVTPNSVILARIAEQEAAEDGIAPQSNSVGGASSRTSRADAARAEIAEILASKRSAPSSMRARTAVARRGGDDETRARIRQETAERERARVEALGLWPDEVPAEQQ